MQWIKRIPCLASAALAAGSGIMFWWLVRHKNLGFLLWPAILLIVLAIAFAACAFMKPSVWQSRLRTVAILFLNTAILFGVVELVCRTAGINLASVTGQKERFEKYPVYFRLPTKPVGDVFFQRPGPQEWTGRVLNTTLENLKSTDDAYPDEAEITVFYDKDGFRNPDDLEDWEIAVAGDSMTEAGFLPHDQMFTSVLAEKSGLRVKHLGVSFTGTYSHAYYFRSHGKAASTRQAVLAFFEGNDIEDNVREFEYLQEFRRTGKRPYRNIERETSLFKAAYVLAKNFRHANLKQRSYANASWVFEEERTPISTYSAHSGSGSLGASSRHALRAALDDWSASCTDLGVKPWLLYLPYKRRVLDGMLEFPPETGEHIANWQPNDMPEYVAGLCRDRGIRFIDATAALSASCQSGVLTHNTIYDTHLNREGCRIVGELLAEKLGAASSDRSSGSDREETRLDSGH